MTLAEKPSGKMSSDDARQGIQSLEIGVRLFQELHRLGRSASLNELAELSRMPPAKVHRYCVSLIRTGLMQQDGRGRYSVGPFGFQLSHPQAGFEHACKLAEDALPALVREISETTFLARWGQTGPYLLKVVDAPRPISIRPTMQGDLPLLITSTARVFAAFMPRERIEPLVDAVLQKQKADERLSATEVAARRATFARHLVDARKRKLARTTGERYPGLVSFSAPIFDCNGEVILALTAFGLSATLSTSWEGQVPRKLAACAQDLTRRIGGKAPG